MNPEIIKVLFVLFVVLSVIGVALFCQYVVPRIKTRPPVNAIMKLIAENETFDISDDISEEDRRRCSHFVDFVVYDPSRNVKTYLYRDGFSGSVFCTGDLSWMNRWERNRVMSLIEGIFSSKRKIAEIARGLEQEKSYDRRRKEAIEFYGNKKG